MEAIIRMGPETFQTKISNGRQNKSNRDSSNPLTPKSEKRSLIGSPRRGEGSSVDGKEGYAPPVDSSGGWSSSTVCINGH